MNTRLPAWSYTTLIAWAAILGSAFQILISWRAPSAWAYTHFIFPCSGTFAKRTLIGCSLEKISFDYFYTYEFFYLFSIALSIAFFVCLIYLACIPIRLHRTGNILPLIALATSVTLSCLSGIAGYFDFIGFLALMMIITAKNLHVKLALFSVLFATSLMVHEAIVILFAPLAAAHIYISQGYASSNKLQPLLLAALTTLLMIFSLVVANSHLEQSVVSTMQQIATQKASSEIAPIAFDIFVRGISDNTEYTLQSIDLLSQSLNLNTWSFFQFMPAALLFTAANFLILRKSLQSNIQALFFSGLPLSPLALTYVGLDWVRWISWATINSFVLYCLLCKENAATYTLNHPAWYIAVVMVAIWGVTHPLTPLY